MNRFRKPWSLSRRETDGAQTNTSDEARARDEEKDNGFSGKHGPDPVEEAIDHGHGHLQEIEVDLDHAVHDREIRDIDEDTSPYPEVRAVVPETDDPTIPVNTLRMWILGTIWVFVGAGVNQFFSLRYPAVHIVSIVAELLAYPMGRGAGIYPTDHDSRDTVLWQIANQP